MKEFDPIQQDRKKADAIRRQYLEKGSSKLEQLQALHEKVKAPGTVIACILGILGALLMGAGMAHVIVWSSFQLGLGLSIPGMALVLLAYPIYQIITGMRKKKYARQILALSEEIMGEYEK